MDFLTAWNFVNEHLYFAVVDSKTEAPLFLEVDFKNNFFFTVHKNRKNGHIFDVEFYTLSADLKESLHNYRLDFRATSYEEAVIKIATWVNLNFGDVKLWDFFVIDKQNPEILNGTLNEKNKNHWDVTKIKLIKEEWQTKKTTKIK